MEKISLGDRDVGPREPIYFIAEMSANHNQDYDTAVKIIHAAAEAGADAIKTQTYTPDTLTLDSNRREFLVGDDTIWGGRSLHDLYEEAYTPWDWQSDLKQEAENLGLDFLSTAYDPTSVEFLEDLGVDVHKVASFELIDLPLIRKMASTCKPLIISTGMGTLAEIERAVSAAKKAGCDELILLKCTSAYPAPYEEMNLKTIPHLSDTFHVPVGLSDHSLGTSVPVSATSFGICVIEKHFTLSRDIETPDSDFSLEPDEFNNLVEQVKQARKAQGEISYEVTEHESATREFRPSLWVVEDVDHGDRFSHENVKSLRPNDGLSPRYLDDVIGKEAIKPIDKATPLSWQLIGNH